MRALLAIAILAVAPFVAALDAQVPAPQVAPPAVRWLVLVDDLHLRFTDTGRLRTALRQMVDEASGRGDAVAWMSTGPSNLRTVPTADPMRHAEAIKRVTGNGLRTSDVIRSLVEADMPFQEPFYRATVTLSAARDWLRSMPGDGGRPVLVFVSEGLAVAADDPAVAPALSTVLQRWDVARDAVRARRTEVVEVVRGARIAVLAFDPREPAAASAIEPGVDAGAQVALLALQRDSLRALAAATAGVFAEGPRELGSAMAMLRAMVVR